MKYKNMKYQSPQLKQQRSMMKFALVGLICILSLCATAIKAYGDDAVSPTDAKAFHVFLLVGQSNMAGRAKMEAVDKVPIKGAFLWNIKKKKWEPALPPYNRYSPHAKKPSMQRLNPGPSFVREYIKANPGVSVGIIRPVRGGTRIEHWKKGETKPWSLFDTAVKATREALKAGGELKGILWHQGEGNSSPTRVPKYPAQLKQLIADFRADFKEQNLPFVFSQIGQFNPEYAAFNKMITQQSKAISQTACIVTDNLKNRDKAHFNTDGQRALGKRYAKAMLVLLKKANKK